MSFAGIFEIGSTIDVKFCTVQSTGAPTTLSASPVISAYPANSTTEITAGITLTADFDSRTGFNNVRVVASTANGYLPNTEYYLVITTGTVNSVSAVGYVVGGFSLGRQVDGRIASGTLQSATSTTAVLLAATDFTATDQIKGATIFITGGTGFGQSRVITTYTNSSDTATVDTWTTTPDNTSTYSVYATPPAVASGTLPKVDVDTIKTNPVVNAGTITFPTTATLASTTNITAGTIATVTNVTTVNGLAANTITAASIATDAITAAKIAADAIGASELATDAVTEIVNAVLTTAMTESYNTDGSPPTVAQALHLLIAALTEFSVSSTTVTLKKLDGSTTAATLTLDSASAPTSTTRAS